MYAPLSASYQASFDRAGETQKGRVYRDVGIARSLELTDSSKCIFVLYFYYKLQFEIYSPFSKFYFISYPPLLPLLAEKSGSRGKSRDVTFI